MAVRTTDHTRSRPTSPCAILAVMRARIAHLPSFVVLIGGVAGCVAGCAFESSPLQPQSLGVPDAGQNPGASGTTGTTGGTGGIKPGQPTGGTGGTDAGPPPSSGDAGKDAATDAGHKDAGPDATTVDAGTDTGTLEFCAVPANAGSACDDGMFCTTGETCAEGVCGGGMPTDCSSLDDACNEGACNEAEDRCEAMPANEGDTCGDGLFCTMSTTCHAGVCAHTYCAPGENCMLNSCPQNCKCDTVCGDAKDCRAGCGTNSTCRIDCGGAESCRYTCSAGATCDVDCTNADTCVVACNSGMGGGSTCDIDCTDANDCTDVQCAFGSQCLLRCNGASDCGFATSGACWMGATSCDGGIQVCGRMCP